MWYERKEINRGSKLYNSSNIRRDRKKSQTYSIPILKRNRRRRRRRRKGGTEERIEGRKNRRKENKSIDVSGNL